jgi:hypothetical protein
LLNPAANLCTHIRLPGASWRSGWVGRVAPCLQRIGPMGKRRVRLELGRESLRRLDAPDLAAAAGGVLRETCTARLSGCSLSVSAHPINQICCH